MDWSRLVAQRGFAVTILGNFQAPTRGSPEQPAVISHLTLLGAGGWARDLPRSLHSESSCDLMNTFSYSGLALLSKAVVYVPALSCCH